MPGMSPSVAGTGCARAFQPPLDGRAVALEEAEPGQAGCRSRRCRRSRAPFRRPSVRGKPGMVQWHRSVMSRPSSVQIRNNMAFLAWRRHPKPATAPDCPAGRAGVRTFRGGTTKTNQSAAFASIEERPSDRTGARRRHAGGVHDHPARYRRYRHYPNLGPARPKSPDPANSASCCPTRWLCCRAPLPGRRRPEGTVQLASLPPAGVPERGPGARRLPRRARGEGARGAGRGHRLGSARHAARRGRPADRQICGALRGAGDAGAPRRQAREQLQSRAPATASIGA